ncbi:MAG TPA: RecX family transcriptional regulator [Allosphingosinicella sp.]|nr:RecX family transcriptional regulator [Allosphingosinicella sp.]
MERRRNSRDRPPLDAAALEALALFYVARYATTRSKLARYLERKLRERGWSGSEAPPIERIVGRAGSLGYVDDRAFAAARAAALAGRGYGERRIREALRAAGIEEEDSLPARRSVRGEAWQSALRLAERRRIGPFASGIPDRAAAQKALAILLRAGHPPDLARRVAYAPPGEIPEPDEA